MDEALDVKSEDTGGIEDAPTPDGGTVPRTRAAANDDKVSDEEETSGEAGVESKEDEVAEDGEEAAGGLISTNGGGCIVTDISEAAAAKLAADDGYGDWMLTLVVGGAGVADVADVAAAAKFACCDSCCATCCTTVKTAFTALFTCSADGRGTPGGSAEDTSAAAMCGSGNDDSRGIAFEAAAVPAEDSDDTADRGRWTAPSTLPTFIAMSAPDGNMDDSGPAEKEGDVEEEEDDDDGYGEGDEYVGVEERPAPLAD